MKSVLSLYKAEEYITISALIAITFFCAVLAVFVNNDPFIIVATVASLSAVLIYVGHLKPIHFFYTICFSASFLPYINLSMFPLASIYVFGFLFAILTLISFLKVGRRIFLPQPAKWMFVFLAIALFSIINAPDKRQVIIYVGQFLIYIAIYIAAVNLLESKKQILQSIKYILYGSIIPIAACLVQFVLSFISLQFIIDTFYKSIWGKLFIGTRGLQRLEGDAIVLINRATNVGSDAGDSLFRVFGTFVGPTGFGSYLMLMTVLAGALFIIQHRTKRIGISATANGLLFGALSIFLILTWTRAAWLAFFIAFAFVLVYKRTQNIKLFTGKNITLILAVIIIPVLLFVVLLLLNIPLATTVLLSITTLGGGSTAARLATMLFAGQYIISHPFLGIGWGNYGHAAGINMSSSTASFASAHNRYLELGVELGLPGLAAYLMIIISFMRQALALIRAPLNSFYHTLGIAFFALWIGYLVKSMFAGSVIHPRTMVILWALAGIQAAAYQHYLNEKKKENTIYRIETAH